MKLNMNFDTLGNCTESKQDKSVKYNPCEGRTFHSTKQRENHMIGHGHLTLPMVLTRGEQSSRKNKNKQNSTAN